MYNNKFLKRFNFFVVMGIKKGDFVEIDFTGKLEDGSVFDTTIKDVAMDNKLKTENIKPFSLSVGFNMLPKGLDEDIIDKDVGKDYTVKITPEKAFGVRNKELVKMVPTKLFFEQNIRPERGMQLSLDGQIVKIMSVSGGRTLVDFNNPLAGKDITYEYRINKKIEDEEEKINSLQDFFFNKRFNVEQKDNKIILKLDEEFKQYFVLLKEKFQEILGKEVDAE